MVRIILFDQRYKHEVVRWSIFYSKPWMGTNQMRTKVCGTIILLQNI